MNGWAWLPAGVALLGAGFAFLGAWAGTRQRDRAGRREEWGRRFTAALEATARDSERARILGRSLLVELARSELASGEEQRLAGYLIEQEARYSQRIGAVTSTAPAMLDQMRFIEDTGATSVPGVSSSRGES